MKMILFVKSTNIYLKKLRRQCCIYIHIFRHKCNLQWNMQHLSVLCTKAPFSDGTVAHPESQRLITVQKDNCLSHYEDRRRIMMKLMMNIGTNNG